MPVQRNNKISQGLLLGALFIGLQLLTVFIPSSELLILFILPIPIAIYGYRYGWKASSILSIIILLVFSILSYYLFIVLTLMTALTGILIGESIRAKLHHYETWGRATVGFVLGFLVLFIVLELISPNGLVTEYQLVMRESLDSAQSLFNQAGIEMNVENTRLIEQQMMNALNLLPAIIIIASMLYGFISQWLVYKSLNKWDKKKMRFPIFRTFNLPRVVLWIYFVITIVSWFSAESQSGFSIAILNIAAVISILFSIQGLSLISHYTFKKDQPTIVFVLIVIASIIFFPIGLYLTRILGIIDIGFLLKKRVI